MEKDTFFGNLLKTTCDKWLIYFESVCNTQLRAKTSLS